MAADGGTGERGTGVEGERVQQRSRLLAVAAARRLRPSGLRSAPLRMGWPAGRVGLGRGVRV